MTTVVQLMSPMNTTFQLLRVPVTLGMSKSNKMYRFDRTIGLVTIASQLNENIALLDVNEVTSADTLAVIHEGFVNYIPLYNNLRRSKYLSVADGTERGRGQIKKIKWMNFPNEIYFVILSTLGMKIYDAELTEKRFDYIFKSPTNLRCFPVGASVMGDFLYVGVDDGHLYVFRNIGEKFRSECRLFFGDFSLFDGFKHTIVTSSKIIIKFYEVNECKIDKRHEVAHLSDSVATVLKVFDGIVLIGYHCGALKILVMCSYTEISVSDAHQSQITDFDYTKMKRLILSCAKDGIAKLWNYDDINDTINCVYRLQSSDENPYAGVAFMNLTATEFCCVSANSLSVKMFVKSLDDE